MAYNKTSWGNLPSTNTPVNATNLNKIENELEKLDPATPYTQVTGTYTTAQWSAGTNNCTWTAPRTGLYILWARFDLQTDTNGKVYKQLQLRGTATRISGDLLLYQDGETDSSTGSNKQSIAIYEGSKLIYAEQGQTIIPYIHTAQAGIVWNIRFTGLFLK